MAKTIELTVPDAKRVLEVGKEAAFRRSASPRRHEMKAWPKHPVIYEINTCVAGELGRKYQRP